MEANVDLIGTNGLAQGPMANQIMNNGSLNVGRMRPFVGTNGRTYVSLYKGGDPTLKTSFAVQAVNTNGTLRRDEWKKLDEALMQPARYRLGGIADLIANGLTYNLGNAMGTTVLEWHDVGEALSAVVTMDGITRGKNDTVNYQTNYLPIPIIHADYEINARLLAASRNMGNALDTTLAERAAWQISNELEKMLFTDTTFAFGELDGRGRNKIYSYLNFPDRNLVNLSTPWDGSAITSAGILQDVMEMLAAAATAYHYGPFALYIPTAYQGVLGEDYNIAGTSLMTVRERIMKLEGIKSIKVIDTLPANNVLLVEMNPLTVRLINGLGLTNVQYDQEAGMVTKFKAMTIQVPQIRSDQNGKCGVVHLS